MGLVILHLVFKKIFSVNDFQCICYVSIFVWFDNLLQARLQEFLGRKDLDKHLDADEAVVLGAALHAANLSDGIKLNRKLGMIDGSTYGIVVEFDGPDFIKDEHSSQLLVPRMKKVPTKVTPTLVSAIMEKGYTFLLVLIFLKISFDRCLGPFNMIRILKFSLTTKVQLTCLLECHLWILPNMAYLV